MAAYENIYNKEGRMAASDERFGESENGGGCLGWEGSTGFNLG